MDNCLNIRIVRDDKESVKEDSRANELIDAGETILGIEVHAFAF